MPVSTLAYNRMVDVPNNLANSINFQTHICIMSNDYPPQIFTVNKNILYQSQTLLDDMPSYTDEQIIKVPIFANVLRHAIAYMDYHNDVNRCTYEWDKNFLKPLLISDTMIFKLAHAAIYLKIDNLISLLYDGLIEEMTAKLIYDTDDINNYNDLNDLNDISEIDEINEINEFDKINEIDEFNEIETYNQGEYVWPQWTE